MYISSASMEALEERMCLEILPCGFRNPINSLKLKPYAVHILIKLHCEASSSSSAVTLQLDIASRKHLCPLEVCIPKRWIVTGAFHLCWRHVCLSDREQDKVEVDLFYPKNFVLLTYHFQKILI